MKAFGFGPAYSSVSAKREVTLNHPAVSGQKMAHPMIEVFTPASAKFAKRRVTQNPVASVQDIGPQPVKSAFKSISSSKKRVTMNSTVSVHEFSDESMTKEEKSDLYFTKDDYNMTILEVKAIALTHQQPQVSDNINSNNCLVAAEADGFLRGIESHLYPQRFQNRLVARRALIKYQTHLRTNCIGITPDQQAKAMRIASEKLSAWSQLVAQETARLDSIRADYLIPLEGGLVEFSSYPDFTFQRREVVQETKRVIPSSEDPPRPLKKLRAMCESAA